MPPPKDAQALRRTASARASGDAVAGPAAVTTRGSSTNSYDPRSARQAGRRIRLYGAPGRLPGRGDAAFRLLPRPPVLHLRAYCAWAETGRLPRQIDET